jgi:16S rRNA (adenine1518-N6/adenine1519-N6)-dimethyltransferase
MPTEDIFDIVDDADRVIGSAPRSVVHNKGHLHRATHIWLSRPDGHVLIQLRSASKDRHPRTWDSSACGHVDSGEDYLTAARRECCEELGLPQAPELVEIAYCTDTKALDHEFVKVYRGVSYGPFSPMADEVDEVRWVSTNALTDWMRRDPKNFAPSFIHLWMKYGHLAPLC